MLLQSPSGTPSFLPFLGYPAFAFELIFSLLLLPLRPTPPHPGRPRLCPVSLVPYPGATAAEYSLTRSRCWAGVSGQDLSAQPREGSRSRY